MLLLAIDTSTPMGSIALWENQGLSALLTVSVKTTHSEGLLPAINTILQRTQRKQNEITHLAVISGPGSYTGLRIGIATAQGLAFSRQLPCVSLTAFEVLAWAFPHTTYTLCPMLPARRGWIYAQLYEWHAHKPVAKSEELNIQPEELIHYIQSPTIFYGPGLPDYEVDLQEILTDDFLAVPKCMDCPRAELLAEIAFRKILQGESVGAEKLQPHYLGPSQAEINWKKRQKE